MTAKSNHFYNRYFDQVTYINSGSVVPSTVIPTPAVTLTFDL